MKRYSQLRAILELVVVASPCLLSLPSFLLKRQRLVEKGPLSDEESHDDGGKKPEEVKTGSFCAPPPAGGQQQASKPRNPNLASHSKTIWKNNNNEYDEIETISFPDLGDLPESRTDSCPREEILRTIKKRKLMVC